MNFNSVSYFLFLPAAAITYYIFRPKYRNLFLLAASYYFYMCWKAEYAVLIFFSTFTTYICALFMEKSFLGKRKLWLVVNLLINFSILFFFKYFNFTASLFGNLIKFILPNHSFGGASLNILLPVGISFYTFQALGYTIDVYRKNIPAEKSFIDYALFVSFFPQLVAGPIERSNNLLPQFKTVHKLNLENFHQGFLLILWGLLKKLIIADRLAILVNYTYSSAFEDITAAGYIIAAVSFSFQIYCDFSAYSDIARGSAGILGFSLMENFKAPYMSVSVKEFWRKWHISLSTWFKDYLYFPLGGSRCGKIRNYFNILVVFTVSGLWHGASLNFVFWGLLNGIYQIIEDIFISIGKLITNICPFRTSPKEKNTCFNLIKNIITRITGGAVTFGLITYAFIFFRVPAMSEAILISKKIFNLNNLKTLSFTCITELGIPVQYLWVLAAALILLLMVDFIRKFMDLAKKISRTVFLKYIAYFTLIILIVVFGYYGSSYDPQEFIYFQF